MFCLGLASDKEKYMSRADPERKGVRTPSPRKSEVAIGFLRNSDTPRIQTV